MADRRKVNKSNINSILKKKWVGWLFLYFAMIAVCILFVYVIPSVRGILTRTYITEQSEIELSDEVEAYIVRDESVFTAAKAGKIERLGEEGKLIKGWTRVVDISGAGPESSNTEFLTVLEHLGDKVVPTENGVSEIAGYVCYTIDGAEGVLDPSDIMDTRREVIEKAGSYARVDVAGRAAASGDPLFKVVRNGKWYMVCYLDNKAAEKYTEDKKITIRIGERNLEAKVKEVRKGKATSKLLLSCGVTYDGFMTDRKVDAVIVAASAKGLLLKDKSIIEKDGKKGVLVKNKLGNYIFKEVCVKADDGENCVVYQDLFMDEKSNFVETLSIYDEIVESPSEEDIEKAE